MNQKDIRYYLVMVSILLISVGIGIWQAAKQQETIKEDLLEFVKIMALNVSPSMIGSLQRDGSDLQNPQYQQLKSLLTQAAAIETKLKFAYVFGIKPDDTLFFYADSEPADSPDYSPPGQIYEDASPQDLLVFKKGLSQAFANSDAWGNWISVEIPIFDETGSRVIASMNVDIPQNRYYRQIIFAGMVPFLVGIVFALVLFVIRRLSLKDEMMLNQRAVYLAITAHDLKTPLTAIKWTAEILKESLATSENTIKDNITAISNACQEMFTFIDDLASASETNVKNLVSSKRLKIDIGELTKKVALSMELSIGKKNLRINYDIDEGLAIMGDPNALRRAIANLISNAVKYSEPGGNIDISIKSENGKLIWSIKDTGIGIPKDDLPKVLMGYYRAKNAKLSGIAGTGLGLYYTKKVIEACRGKLSLASPGGKGTVVTITIPLSIKD
jgi:signal transduction histidine kinase